MKTAVALLLAMFLSVLAVHASDPGPAGRFRGLKWGDPPAADMVDGHTKLAGMDVYLRHNDGEKVAGRDTGFISYNFYKNALCEVIVGWDLPATRATLDSLATELVTAWGTPDQTSATGERAWLSRDGITLALLKRSESGGAATLMLGPLPCARAAAADAAGLTASVSTPPKPQQQPLSAEQRQLQTSVNAYVACVLGQADRRAAGTAAPSDIADAALADCGLDYVTMQMAYGRAMASVPFAGGEIEGALQGYAFADKARDDARRAAISRVLRAREP